MFHQNYWPALILKIIKAFLLQTNGCAYTRKTRTDNDNRVKDGVQKTVQHSLLTLFFLAAAVIVYFIIPPTVFVQRFYVYKMR